MRVMTEVKILDSWRLVALDFANKSMESRKSKLKSRGQTNPAKIKLDIACGAIAELAVKQWWQERYAAKLLGPDFNVYEARKKSWTPDLVCESVDEKYGVQPIANLHVKTFTNPKWSSWVFTYHPDRQDMDPVITTPQDNDFLVLTQVGTDSVTIHYYLKAKLVGDLYRAPILPQLARSKLCLYPSDIDRYLKERA